jgi:hypothetical protein
MAVMQTIARTLAGGGGGKDPPSNPSSQIQNPQRIRDTFNITLGRASRPPNRPGGPGRPRGPGGPEEPPVPPAHLIPIQPAGELKQAGMTPKVCDRERTKAEAFLRELRLYMMANQGPGFESPIRRIAITLTFIKGPRVDGWVEAMLQAIEQLNPIEDNVEYAYTDFLNSFQTQFTDSTKEEAAQATLDKHQFKFPFIDQYISDFETLVRKAGYMIGSRESMNYFLKGLKAAPDVMEQVVKKYLHDYQDLKEKAIMVVKA